MSIKGIIFDFNGTLLWDTPLHNFAWDRFLSNHQVVPTEQEKNEKIHGKTNRDIFEGLFNRKFDTSELAGFIDEKENIYRQLVIDQQLELAPGAIALFEKIRNRGIASTIATASGLDNLQFYFQRYKLDRWFNFERVVYDNGSLRGKPNPDFFREAIKKLELKPEECLVFEDSYAGIKAAENAHAGQIVIVNSAGADYSAFQHRIITSFDQFEPDNC